MLTIPRNAHSWERDLAVLRTGDGREIPRHLRAELDRLRRRLVMTLELIREVEAERDQAAKTKPQDQAHHKIAALSRIPALRFEVAADGAVTDRPTDVIAADLRNTSDGRDLALAKVVARMLGVPTDDVRKRQAIAQSWRLKVIAALVTVVAVLSLVAGFLVWEHNREVAVDDVREKERVAREVERDKQLAEMHSLVQNLLGISVAKAAPGAAKALGDAVTVAQEGAAQGDERLQKALDLLKAGKPQDAEPLARCSRAEESQSDSPGPHASTAVSSDRLTFQNLIARLDARVALRQVAVLSLQILRM